MKKLLLIPLLFLFACGNNNPPPPPQYQNYGTSASYDDGYDPRNVTMENTAYGRYQDCMRQTGNNYQMCSGQTNITIHHDNSGSKFFEYLGEYYLLSSMINGRPYNYYGSYGYYPSLGYGFPTHTVVNNYVTHYNTLPQKSAYIQQRQATHQDRVRRADTVRQKKVAQKRDSDRPRTTKNADQKSDKPNTRPRDSDRSRSTDTRRDDKPATRSRDSDRPRSNPSPKSSTSSSSSSTRRK